jgi:hypothetical protein
MRVGTKIYEMLKTITNGIKSIINDPKSGRLQFTRDLYNEVFATQENIRNKILDLRKISDLNRSIESTPYDKIDPHLAKAIESSDLTKLTEGVSKVVSPSTRNSVWNKMGDVDINAGGIKNILSSAFRNVKDSAASAYFLWKNAPVETTYKDLFGNYLQTRTKTSWAAREFSKEILRKMPDKARREAIVNYVQADGNLGILKAREGATEGRFKAGYKIAQELTPTEIQFANDVKDYFGSKLDIAIKTGMLKHGIENYVNQLYGYAPAAKNIIDGIRSEFIDGNLKLDPSILKKRIYDTYFDAEQKGLIPKNKDIGFLLNVYDRSFNEALAARTFIKDLFNNGTAKDGRPMLAFSKGGDMLPMSEMVNSAEFILHDKVDVKGKQAYTGDYMEISHPALRGWRHFEITPDGQPMFMDSKLLIHPDIYKTAPGEPDMKSFLTKSKLQENVVGRLALKVSSELKNTMLSLSMFHQVQEGLHAVFHRVDPTGKIVPLKDINMNDPHQAEFVKRGLMISDFDGSALFSEGVQASGLINRVPILGDWLQKYNQYLFTDYIPRLKMNMALEAYERNTARYGKELSKTQVYEMTSQQSNAAFGELNYLMLGRSKTMQDILRLTLLAPDFLEARARFVTQALSPLAGAIPGQKPGYGKEQAVAILVGGLGLYGAGIVANMLVSGKPYYDKPLTLVYNNKEYMLRTVPGDLVHLVTDPRSFIYNRLNPVTTRTIIEGLTSRDKFGKKKSAIDQVGEFIATQFPIPLQGMIPKIRSEIDGMPVSKKDRNIVESVINSFGVATKRYRTDAEQLIAKNVPIIEDPNENRQAKKLHRAFVENYRDTGKILPEVIEAKAKHIIDQRQIGLWTKEARKPEISNLYKHINDLGVLQQIYDVATPEEQKVLRPTLNQKKLNLRLRTPQ